MGDVPGRSPDDVEEGNSLDTQTPRMQASAIMRGVGMAVMHAEPALSPDACRPETHGHTPDTRPGVSGAYDRKGSLMEPVLFLF